MHKIALRPVKPARLGLSIALLAGLASLMTVVWAAPQIYYKLSSDGPLPIGGDVHDFEISADGIVYGLSGPGRMSPTSPNSTRRGRTAAAESVKVSALPDDGGHIAGFAVSPDNAHVVYNADQDTQDVRELYSAPLDGSAAPIKLSGEMVEGGGLDQYNDGFLFSPDGGRVVYRADQDTDEVNELYSVPVDGSAAAVKLNAELPDGGGTGSYAISPDSQYVVYTANQDSADVFELYRVPLDGGAEPVKLDRRPRCRRRGFRLQDQPGQFIRHLSGRPGYGQRD